MGQRQSVIVSGESTGQPSRGKRAVSPGRIVVSLFDSVSFAQTRRPIQIKNKKAQALLGYLLLTPSQRESRERLSGLLWSESSEEKARGSLRQTLHQLRETFDEGGIGGLTLGRDDVSLEKASFDVDVWSVLQDAARQQVHPLLLDRKRLSESLMVGLDEVDPSFRAWLLVQRQAIHERLERHLETALAGSHATLSAVKSVAAALLNLDPTHEAACRALMQTYAASGDIAGALRVYKNLWDLLDEEYDVEPSPETQALVVEIKTKSPQGEGAPPSLPAVIQNSSDIRIGDAAGKPGPAIPAAAPSRKFIMSINAFDSSGVGSNRVHIIDGFRRELIACLVRFREWYVRDAGMNSAALASHDAAAEYFIEANALQVGEAIRLILTLREAGSEHYVWSDRYQITRANWFEAQQAIVRRIAMALNVHLSTERLARAAGEHGGAPHVYDRWLRGQALIQNYNESDWKRAADICRQIINEMPNFAPAYSSLVQLNNSAHLVRPGIQRSREREVQTLELARTAVRLDPVDSRAQLSLAWAHLMAKQYAQAEINLALAYDLNENDPWTLISTSLGYAFCGSFDRANDLAAEALKLSLAPSRTHWGYQVGIRFLCGDYEGCVEAAARASDVIPNLPGWKASALFHLGLRDAAKEEARRFVALIRSKWFRAEQPDEEMIARWFLHLFPIRQKEGWERLRDGLAGAGVDVGTIQHHEW